MGGAPTSVISPPFQPLQQLCQRPDEAPQLPALQGRGGGWWPGWIQTNEGVSCSPPPTLPTPPHLRERCIFRGPSTAPPPGLGVLLCFAAKNSLFGQRGDRRRWEGRPPHPPSGVVSPLGVTKTIRGVLVPAPPAAYGSVRFWGGLGGDRWPRLHCRRSGPLGWRRGSRRSRHGWGGPWG